MILVQVGVNAKVIRYTSKYIHKFLNQTTLQKILEIGCH